MLQPEPTVANPVGRRSETPQVGPDAAVLTKLCIRVLSEIVIIGKQEMIYLGGPLY